MTKPLFPIGCWTYFIGIDDAPDDLIQNWVDLGITTPLAPGCGSKENTLAFLDKCLAHGIYPYLNDGRVTSDKVYNDAHVPDYAAYREKVAQAVADYGHHPAVSGFFIQDEPSAEEWEPCLEAAKIHLELAPHLTPFLNFLPWFDNDPGHAKRMGVTEQEMRSPAPLARYLDESLYKSGMPMMGYDCYTQQYRGTRGWDTYFSNLRQYHDFVRRHPGTIFNTTLLCVSHFDYYVETEEDFRWQINTAAAMGAKALWWFYPDMRCGDGYNYREAPINQLAERTPNFTRMSTEVRLFTKQYGDVMATLTPEDAYLTVQSYGGMPLFGGDADVVRVDTVDQAAVGPEPMLVSFFHNDDGTRYLALVNCSRTDSHAVVVFAAPGVTLTQLMWNGNYLPWRIHGEKTMEKNGRTCYPTDMTWFAPGQLNLYRIGHGTNNRE